MNTNNPYKLGGVNVVDIDGTPFYAGTQIPLKRNNQTGAPLQTYNMGGQSVYDRGGIPHYLANDKPLQVDQTGRPTAYLAPVTNKTNTTNTEAKLDPNATETYASNFKAGKANKDAMQDYFKGQKNGENLATWAAANPALAYKAYTKGVAKEKAQDQRDLMSDYRVMNQDVSKGEGFNKAEFAAINGGKGGSVEVDIDGSGVQDVRINPQAQAFKDNLQMSLINTLNNKNITPIVKGMELPDMSKYAGIFNQTDAPDYKTMMENNAMGQLAENLGLPVNTYNTNNYFDRMFGK